jgi:hypothetical protein
MISNLTVATLNVQGISTAWYAVDELIEKRIVDVLVATETWLKERQSVKSDYVALSITEPLAPGHIGCGKGGIAVLARRELHPYITLISNNSECHTVTFSVGDVTVMGCYWAPSLSEELVLLQLQKLDSLPPDKPCLLIGDVNGRLGEQLNDSVSNRRGKIIANHLDSKGWQLLSRQVSKGRWTYLQGNNRSVVDWMAGNSCLQFEPFLLCIYDDAEFAGSDHKLVSCTI